MLCSFSAISSLHGRPAVHCPPSPLRILVPHRRTSAKFAEVRCTVRIWRGWRGVGVGGGAQKPAFSRKPGCSEATGPLAKSLWQAGGCPLRPKSAIESHLRLAESFCVHEPVSTSQFAAVAAPPPRNHSLRYRARCRCIRRMTLEGTPQSNSTSRAPLLGPLAGRLRPSGWSAI